MDEPTTDEAGDEGEADHQGGAGGTRTARVAQRVAFRHPSDGAEGAAAPRR